MKLVDVDELCCVMGSILHANTVPIEVYNELGDAIDKLSFYPQKGEWLTNQRGAGIFCSVCNKRRRYMDKHDKYCPNCGTEMEGVK